MTNANAAHAPLSRRSLLAAAGGLTLGFYIPGWSAAAQGTAAGAGGAARGRTGGESSTALLPPPSVLPVYRGAGASGEGRDGRGLGAG